MKNVKFTLSQYLKKHPRFFILGIIENVPGENKLTYLGPVVTQDFNIYLN